MINAILNLLRSDGYITVHKTLIRNIGLVPATVFSELCSKYKYYFDCNELKNGYFYFTIPKAESELGLSRKEQDTALNKLIAVGLIEKKVMKLKGDDSPKRYIKITQDLNLILKYMQGKKAQPIENTGFVRKGHIDLREKDKSGNCGENGLNPLKTLDFSDLSEKDISTCEKGAANKITKEDLNNKKTKNTHTTLENSNEVEVKTPSKTMGVCVDNTPSKKEENIQEPKAEEVERLQEEIKEATGQQISVKKIRKLLASSSIERIQFHLKNWHIHKEHQKSEGAGWFFTVVENDITPEKKTGRTGKKKEGRIPQQNNFEQRKYSKGFLESFYADFTENPSTSQPEEKKPYTYIMGEEENKPTIPYIEREGYI